MTSSNSTYLIPAWCHQLRSKMSRLFESDMQVFLERLPSLLIKESEKSAPMEQQLYFDIVSVLQSNKIQLSKSIVNQSILNAINDFEAMATKNAMAPKSNTLSELTLITTEEIEIRVVSEGQAGKVASKLNSQLNNAYLRVSNILPKIKTSSQLPVHPITLIFCMLENFASLPFQVEHKIVLVKAFTNFISTDELASIIEESLQQANIPDHEGRIINKNVKENPANNKTATQVDKDKKTLEDKSKSEANTNTPDMLANLKALNNLEKDLLARGINKFSSYDLPEEEVDDSPSPEEIFAAQQKLIASNANKGSVLLEQMGQLNTLRSTMDEASPLVPKAKNPLVAVETISSGKLDNILHNMQQVNKDQTVSKDTTIQTTNHVRSIINSQLVSSDSKLETISTKDSDIINLVSMLFDNILDNPNLSVEMKALIARLQIPILRVALKTPNFIVQVNHPSRKLLNKITEAGVSCVKSDLNAKFFNTLENFVFKILKSFNNNESLFLELYEELNAFLQKENSQSLRVEERILNKEKKKAESQLAKSEVQKQLNKRLLGKKVPFCVVKLLQNGWWQVLYYTNIRYGVDSRQWNSGLKFVDALLWSIQPPSDNVVEWQKQLVNIQGRIFTNISSGLTQIQFDTTQQKVLLRDIKQIHDDLLAKKDVRSVNILESKDAANADEQYTITGNEENVSLPVDIVSANLKEQEDFTSSDVLKEKSKEVSLLKVGSWVEFDINTDEPTRRKLVAKVRALNKLVFTNRRGVKVAELTNTTLAKLLADHRVRIIDNNINVIDTALGSVLDKIAETEKMTLEQKTTNMS